MATGVASWSKTAASNATADANVNWAEGQAPSTVNNSARAEMASVAMWRDDISGALTTGGSSTAYTITTNQSYGSESAMDKAMICFIPHTNSGTDPTLAVDGLTARDINSSTGVNIVSGALVAGTPYRATFVNASTEWIIEGQLPGTLNITGLSQETALAVGDEFPVYDLSETANNKVTLQDLFDSISILTSETSVATGDSLLLYDASASNADVMTVENLFKVTNAFTEDTAPHGANDFFLSYDASASAPKKVTVTSIIKATNDITEDTSPHGTNDFIPTYDASATAAKKITISNLFKGVNDFTEDTAPDFDSDFIPTYDASASGAKKVTFANLLKGINDLTEDTSPDETADYLVSYDASATLAKKVLPKNLNPEMHAQAWGKFEADGTVLASNNVTGVTQNSTGDWTVTLANDFASADYAIVATIRDSSPTTGGGMILAIRTQSAGSFTVKVYNVSGTDIDPDEIFFACYGTLA